MSLGEGTSVGTSSCEAKGNFKKTLSSSVLSKRACSLPRWAGTTVILFAFLTPGPGFALPLLESRLLPVYALFELHFVFAGLAWLAVGASMPRDQATLARPAYDLA